MRSMIRLRACRAANPGLYLQRCAPRTGGNFAGAPGPCDVHGPALDALKGAAVDASRPLMDNFGHVLSLKSVVDVNDYNIGMPLGTHVHLHLHILLNWEQRLRQSDRINSILFILSLGVIMAGIGCYQLFKTDPWTCLDVVLGYAFYKLSVVSSQVHRRGFANDSITMMKTGKYPIIPLPSVHEQVLD